MILRVGSSSASLLTVIRGRTVTTVKLYLPSMSSSRPSASLSYPAGVSPRAWARERNVSIMQVLTEPTSNSSGAQMFGSPLNSGGLPTMIVGFSAAESRPRRAELQVVLAWYRKDLEALFVSTQTSVRPSSRAAPLGTANVLSGKAIRQGGTPPVL